MLCLQCLDSRYRNRSAFTANCIINSVYTIASVNAKVNLVTSDLDNIINVIVYTDDPEILFRSNKIYGFYKQTQNSKSK